MRFPSHGLWRHPDFLKLWTGQSISIFGSLLGGIALAFTAIAWLDATPLEVAVLAACQLVPGFLVGIVAGVWVDRLRRRPVLIATDLGRFLALGTVPLAAVFDVLTIWQLFAVALIASTLEVFFNSAYRSYLPTLVSAEQLVEGNSKLSATASVAEVGGFGAAGWIVQAATAPGAMLIDSLSFLASALSVWRIRSPEPPPVAPEHREGFFREARAGVGVVTRDPIIRSLVVTNAIIGVASGMIGVTFLLYLNREVGFDPGVLGTIFAVGGLTGLVGAFLAGRARWFGGIGPALALSGFVRAGGMLFMPLAGSVSAAGAACLVASQLLTDPAWAFYDVHDVSIRQAATPQRLQGRMHATVQFTDFGARLAGTVAGGLLGQTIGLRETLFAAVGLSFAAAVWLALSPVARLREAPVAASR